MCIGAPPCGCVAGGGRQYVFCVVTVAVGTALPKAYGDRPCWCEGQSSNSACPGGGGFVHAHKAPPTHAYTLSLSHSCPPELQSAQVTTGNCECKQGSTGDKARRTFSPSGLPQNSRRMHAAAGAAMLSLWGGRRLAQSAHTHIQCACGGGVSATAPARAFASVVDQMLSFADSQRQVWWLGVRVLAMVGACLPRDSLVGPPRGWEVAP